MSEDSPLSFCYQIGPSKAPGYLCIGYTLRFEDHEIDCTPVSMPVPLARQLRQLLDPFRAAMSDHETYVYTHEVNWVLPSEIVNNETVSRPTLETLAFHHSKLAGEAIQIGRVGCWCPDIEEFLALVEEAVAEIDTEHPWSANQPIEWLQRFGQN